MADPSRILLSLHLTSSYARGVLRGVVNYVRSCPERPFQFDVIAPDQLGERLAGSAAAGAICDVGDEPMARKLQATRLPVVNVGDCHPTRAFPQITSDNLQIGRAAAEYLFHRGVRNFGYVGVSGYGFSDGRYQAFASTIAGAGKGHVHSYPGADQLGEDWNWDKHRARLGEWAASLPKPVGVLSCVDSGAKTLVEGALRAGLKVPGEVLVLGVGNDEIECELADVSLTSVGLAEERIGYEAAALLHNMLEGAPPPTEPVHIAPSGVVSRDSTDAIVFEDPELCSAVRYIHDHVADAIKVTDILNVVSMSRRELERRFSSRMGHSPHAEIRYSQLRRAQELLAQTDLPMSQVALAAGFKESKRLSVVFRQETGMSPSEYRLEYRCAPEAMDGPHVTGRAH